jgi:hypothetical protein
MRHFYSILNTPVKLTGHQLAHNHYSKSQLAAFAASIILDEVDFTKPTRGQVAQVFNVSIPYISKALALSPLERAEMRDGNLEMTDLPPPAAELERVIGRAGTDPSWAALCAHMDRLSEREQLG